MDVILREHIDNLGRRGDVVKVAPGYARNFLLPRKLALAVTEANKKQIERERKAGEVKDAQERTEADAYGQRLEALEIEIARRIGENNVMYGSVTSADVREEFAMSSVSPCPTRRAEGAVTKAPPSPRPSPGDPARRAGTASAARRPERCHGDTRRCRLDAMNRHGEAPPPAPRRPGR